MNTRPRIRLYTLRALDRGLVPFALVVLFLTPTVPALSSRLSNAGVFHGASANLGESTGRPSEGSRAATVHHLELPDQDPAPSPSPSPSPSATPAPTPTPKRFSFEPSEISRNTTHTLKITSTNCSTNKFEALDKVISKTDIDDYKTKGIEITPKTLDTPDRCVFTAVLTVTDASAFQDVNLTFHYKVDGTTDQTETIRITMVKQEALPPGPIPPGLKPEVDIMWGVVPQKIVKDNFGRRVGQNFYCIEVVIGNNTGYELQIASVGFNLGPVGDAAKYMAKKIERASSDIANSTEVSEAIAAQNTASGLANIAAEEAARAEIQRRIMEATSDPKEKKEQKDTYEEAQRRAEKSKSDALIAARTATAKKEAAVAVVSARVALVKDEANQLTQLSRIAYAQKIPVGSYMMTRGSLEHGQIWSPRNFIMHGLRALGPFLTGFTPYFHVLNRRNNFSEGINIISNPLEKGFEAVMPDETIDQLQRLDEQILRDGVLIPNNRQFRTRVFIAKDTLRLGKDMNGKEMRDDPMMVTLALGEMYLIGNTVAYLNRVSVTSGPSGEVMPPPTVNPDSYQKEFDLNGGSAYTFTLTGTNLKNAILTSDDPSIEILSGITTTNTTLTGQVEVKDTARLGLHTLNVTNARSTVPVTVTVTQPPAIVDQETIAFSDNNKPSAYLPQEKPFGPLTVGGRFLQGARLRVLGSNPLTASVADTQADGKSFTVKITVPKGVPKGDYKFAVGNTQNDPPSTESAKRVLTVTISERPAPSVTKVGYGEDGSGKKPKVNPAANPPVTLFLTGTNLNDLNDKKPVEQRGDETPVFTIDSFDFVSPTVLRVRLTVPKEARAKTYNFLVVNKEGAKSAEFSIELEKQAAVSIDNAEQSLTAENDKVSTITLNGKDLEGAEIKTKSPDWAVVIESNSGTQLILKVTPKNLTTGTETPFTFNVVNTDTEHPKPVKVKVTLKT